MVITHTLEGIRAAKIYINFRLEDFMTRIGHEDVVSELSFGLPIEEVQAYKQAKLQRAEELREKLGLSNPNLKSLGTQVISCHNAGIVQLFTVLNLVNRNLFTPEEFQYIIMTLVLHDYPEYAKGDTRDYVNTRAQSVDIDERHILTRDVSGCENTALVAWVLFSDRIMREYKFDNGLGNFMFMCDKCDFPASQLAYESIGLGGDIRYKDLNKLNTFDMRSIEITRSHRPADVFLCNLLLNYPETIEQKWFPLFMEFMKSVAWVAREGQDEDSRNLRWLDEYLANY